MPQVPYTGPGAQPPPGTIGLPDDYQRISAGPDAFGAGAAQGMQKLGAGMQQASDAAAQVQNVYDQTAAGNAFAQLRDRVTAAKWGNPADPNAAPGFLTLTGDKAMNAYQPTVAALKQAQSDIAATLSPGAARTFNLQSMRFLGDTFDTFDSHRAVAQKQWQVNSLDAQAATAQSSAIANAGDPTAFLHDLADQQNAIITKGSQLGWSPEVISQQIAAEKSKTYTGAIGRMADVNPQAAWDWYQNNRNNLTGQDQLAVESKLRPGVLLWGSRTAANDLRAAAATGSLTAPSITPDAALATVTDPKARALIGQAATKVGLPPEAVPVWIAALHNESGGSPNLAVRDGTSGEIGPGQIMPSTGAGMGYTPQQLRDPATNLEASARYFGQQWAASGGNAAGALRGYNGGNPGNMKAQPYAAAGIGRMNAWPGAVSAGVPLVIGDSLAQGIGNANNLRTDADSGASPDAVLDKVNAIPVDGVRGQNVVLSSGLSNDPAKLDVVQQQLDSLKARGANVTLMGVGNRPDLAPLNAKLADLAQQNGATFQPIQAGPDGVHPADYKGLGVPSGASGPAAIRPSFPALMAQADQLLDPFGQPNPQFRDMVKSRLRADQAVDEYAQREAEKSYRETLLGAAMGAPASGASPLLNLGQTPVRPTSLDQLLQDPAAKSAWLAASPETQRSTLQLLEHNAHGQDPPMTPAAQGLYYQLSGMATNDREAFQKLDLSDPQYTSALPHSYWNALAGEQRRFGNADVARAAREETQTRALTILKPDLLAAGIKVDGLKPGTTAAATYDTFVGRLRGSLDDFQQANNRRPNDQEVAKIGQALLMQGTQRGTAGIFPWSSDNAVRAFQADPAQFVPTVPPAARQGIVQAYTAKFGQPPTEGQIAEAFMRGQATATGKQPSRAPGNRPPAAAPVAAAPAASSAAQPPAAQSPAAQSGVTDLPSIFP